MFFLHIIYYSKQGGKTMNDSIYEQYMRNVLGYQAMNNNTYDMYYDNWDMSNMASMYNIQMQELENCYPEIYTIVYPMVQRVCSQNTRPITRELVDNMTDEIYYAIEDKEMLENRSKEEKGEDRQIRRNTNLNDLIRILILRELLGRPGIPGGRPPRPIPPRPPMRPPMGPPPRPQPRPGMGPFNRYSFGQCDDLYEK